MKKVKLLLCLMICTLLLGGCGKILNKKEAKQLKENAKIYCGEVHKRLAQEEGYENAVLLEVFVYYIDIYDNSERPDAANVYSKYQLEDGSIIYFNTMISDMKGLGELTDKSFYFLPFEEREEEYLVYREAADTGNLRGDKLKSLGEGVYARESESGASYYFMVDIDNTDTDLTTEASVITEVSTTTEVEVSKPVQEPLKLSGNPEDEYVTTKPEYIETDKFIIFLDEDIKLYGNTPELIAYVMELTETEAGLTLNNDYGYESWGTSGPQYYYDGTNFEGVDPKCEKFHIYVVSDEKSVPCSMPSAVVLNNIDLELAAGEGWTLVHEYTHSLHASNGVNLGRIMEEGFATYVCGKVTSKDADIPFNFDANLNYSSYDREITRENAEEVFKEEFEDGWENYLYGYRFMTFLYEEYGEEVFHNILKDATLNPPEGVDHFENKDAIPYIKKHTSEDVFIKYGDWLEENKEMFEDWNTVDVEYIEDN